jgi:site-specific recombinase XerD
MKKHTISGQDAYLYKRKNSRFWQAAVCIDGKNYRKSTKSESLARAKDVAEDWFLTLRGKKIAGQLSNEKTFADAAKQFMYEYEVLTEGERNERWVQDHYRRLRIYLIPFFGDMPLSKIHAGIVQEYRISRLRPEDESARIPSRSTMHHETVTLRQVLKTAVRHGWLTYVPDISAPYKTSGKISHRAWFSNAEYKRLYEKTRENIKKAKGDRQKYLAEQLHDKILFMANTGMRPDEANCLQYRDVEIIHDEDSDQTILLIEVRGKRGVGYCKSTTGAVRPFERMLKRNKPDPHDLVFGQDHKRQFNRILEENNLKFDRQGNRWTFYSLRHSYISFRLLEGADIYQIAKNCRTSVEMIEKHYAVHLKNNLDASTINVRKGR